MEKTYDLCLEVLERLQKSGILDGMIIIGSWCQYFYKTYFSKVDYSSSIRTRDIDFLVPVPLISAAPSRLTIPKSVTSKSPPFVSSIFPGLTSR